MESYMQWLDSIPIETKILFITLFISGLVAMLAISSYVSSVRFKKKQEREQQPLPTSLVINTSEPAIQESIHQLLTRQNMEHLGDEIIAKLHHKVSMLNQRILEYKDTEIPSFFFRGELGKAKRLLLEKGKSEDSAQCYWLAGNISFVELDLNDCYQKLKKADKMNPDHEEYSKDFDEIASLLETRLDKKKSKPE